MATNRPALEPTSEPPLPESVTVTLWLRGEPTDADATRQARLRARVETLADAGIETAVREHPGLVTDPGTPTEERAIAAFDHFRAVAGRLGIRLDPFFECWTNLDGSRTVRFPDACLVIERDGDLTGLYPCVVDGERFTVADGLDAIADGTAENLR